MIPDRLPKIALLILALMTCLGQAYGQATMANALMTADRERLLVGDQATVLITVKYDPTTTQIGWPQIPDSFGQLEVIEKDRIDTVREGKTINYTQKLKVAGFDSGMFTIPSFSFTVTPKSGSPYTIQTGIVNLLVQTVPVDTTKPFKPIKDIIAVDADKPITGIKIIDKMLREHTGLVVSLLLFLIIAVAYFVLRRRKKQPGPPPPPPEPVHVRSLRMLRELEAEGTWQKGAVKEYYVRLTDILRTYIEQRFGLPAMERTTDELTAAAGDYKGLAEQTDKLYSVLTTADMAKFAKAQPLPDEHITSMKYAKEIIEQTAPTPEPPTTPDKP